MKATGEEPFLPMVRRLEAVGLRAWPAASTVYDGSWQVRLTPGHPSKRINCVVPLDPQDVRDIAGRMAAAGDAFDAAGKTLTIRQSPLCPPEIAAWLADNGFRPVGHTHTMTADLTAMDLSDTLDLLPTQDMARFTDACILIDTARDTTGAVLASILQSIRPPTGLFLVEDETTGPLAVTLAVHDNDLAGLSQVVVAGSARRRGIGLRIIGAALKWARLRGARTAWLQVLADNEPAIGLYRKLGFTTAYDYCYWRRGQ